MLTFALNFFLQPITSAKNLTGKKKKNDTAVRGKRERSIQGVWNVTEIKVYYKKYFYVLPVL